MARQTQGRKHTVAKATLWFVLVMAPSWYVLLCTGGCEFDPGAIGQPPLGPRPVADDLDGGE